MMQELLQQAPSGPRPSSGVRVLALGVFDLLHVGHLRYLQQARALGDHLTVGVATDAISMASKGKRPVVPEQERLEIVSALACVDRACLVPSSTMETERAVGWIRDWKITLVRVGAGWEGSERWLRLAPRLADHGIAVSFAPETPGLSTTHRIQAIRNPDR
jgi:glycerol-3-phosphate cytidylyltransferase